MTINESDCKSMRLIDLDELDQQEEAQKELSVAYQSITHNKLKSGNKVNKKNALKEFLRFVFALTFVVVFTFLVVTFVGQRTRVNGSSMETTLSDHDNLIVDKLSYRFSDPKRYDIVVFPHFRTTESKEIYYIKRIIGLPGETVQILNGDIYINGAKIEEHYGSEVIEDPKMAATPIKLADDEYFVLGDNRNHSSDSREIGAVKRKDIIGRAVFRIWPLEQIGALK